MELSPKLKTELDSIHGRMKGDSRRLLYALVRSQLNEYRTDCERSVISTFGVLTLQCILAIGTGLIFFLICWFILPTFLFDWGIFLVIGFIGTIAYKAKSLTESSQISLYMDTIDDEKGERKVIDRLVLGKVEKILNNRMISFLVITMGLALSIQTSMVWLHSGHMGYGPEVSFLKAILISFDNLLHGVCLDAFEIYGIAIAQSLEELPFVHKTLVFGFRLIYDACFITGGFLLFKRFQMKSLIMSIPAQPTMEQFREWMDNVTQSETGWLSNYTEETMFIVISNHYIHKRHQEVKTLTKSFQHLPVSNAVRDLFIDDKNGEKLWTEAQ